MTDLFPVSDFDDWAEDYDRDVRITRGFPFDGYQRVLKKIFELAAPEENDAVLDLGIGTGNLAQLFAKRGCQIWGLDFSGKMLEQARAKLPQAVLAQADITREWPNSVQREFDCIVSAYTFHHFPLDEKTRLIHRLLNERLLPGGRLVIGDLSFRNADEEDALRSSLGEEWEQEFYWLADETISALSDEGIDVGFQKISSCAGVFTFCIAS